MIPVRHIIGQGIAYLAFAAVVAYFAASPAYQHHDPAAALVRLAITHAGQKVGECHQRTPEELAKLPPNMRAKTACGRERNAVTVEMDIDGRPVFAQTAKPAGLSGDGRSRFYDSREVPAGAHQVNVRLRDTGRAEGWDHEANLKVDLAPRQVFVVDFDDENNTLLLK
ncbi:MAG: hypothetical protein ACM31L_12120 [Actinomycetota bacterium]